MRCILSFLVFLLSFSFCFAQNFTIAAAADLRFALDEIIASYKKTSPIIKIEAIYGSSANLYQQLSNQAPFDIFFSADISYADKLFNQNLTTSKPKKYAVGSIVLWSENKDVSKGIEILKSSTIKKISIANPDHAPYGKRAAECLKYYKIYELVQSKIVKGENVSQAAQFVLTGNADIGIIALSLALSPEMSSKGKCFIIDTKSYSKLDQAYVVMKKSAANKDIKKFLKYIETDPAQKIFKKYGFKIPTD